MARKGNDNKQLHAAIKSKKDEFYTQLSDIEPQSQILWDNGLRT